MRILAGLGDLDVRGLDLDGGHGGAGVQRLDLVVLFHVHTHGVVRDHIAGGEHFFLHERHADEFFGDLARGGVDEADLTILTGSGDRFAIGREGHAEHPARQWRAAELLHVFDDPIVEFLAFAVHGFDEFLHRIGHGAVVFAAINVHRAGSFKRGARDDALAIGREIDAEDATLHRGEFADEVRVVADDAFREALHAVDRGHAVGAADEHFVALRMPCEHLHAAFECAGRDGRDVINEAHRGDLGELHAHVAAAGDDVLAVHAPHGVEHPIAVAAHEERFLARGGVDGPHGIVGAAKRELLAIR